MLLAHSLLIAGDVEQARDVTRQVAAAADATADTELRLLADTCAILDDGATGRGTVADLAALHARAQRLGNVHVALLAAGVSIMAAVREGVLRAGLAWSDRMIAHRLVLGTSDGPVAFELRAVVTAARRRARGRAAVLRGAHPGAAQRAALARRCADPGAARAGHRRATRRRGGARPGRGRPARPRRARPRAASTDTRRNAVTQMRDCGVLLPSSS